VRCLVTGASGFLGRYVVDELLSRGHEVGVLVRDPAVVAGRGWEGRITVTQGDLRRRIDSAALAAAEVVIHLAASLSDSEEQQLAGTVGGTERLMDAVADSGVRRFVLAGSMVVYDWRAAHAVLDESTALESQLELRDGYTMLKTQQERVVRERIGGRELVVLRPGFIWGPGRMNNSGIGRVVGATCFVFGPRRRLPLTYVENCADAFALAAEAPGAAGATVNVVDSDGVRAGIYARFLVRASPELKRVVPVPGLLAKGLNRLGAAVGRTAGRGASLPSLFVPARYDARYKNLRFPAAAAEERLGWTPQVALKEALARSG
jgi:UDP-glucose 4-epimerase